MKTSTKTILFLCSFLIGIALFEQEFYSIKELNLWPLIGMVFLFKMIVSLFSRPSQSSLLSSSNSSSSLSSLSSLSITLLLSFTWAQHLHHTPTPGTIDSYASEEGTFVTIRGQISEEPDIRRDKVNYTVGVSMIKNEEWGKNNEPQASSFQPISGKILIQTGKYPPYAYGDQLEISGNLLLPGQIEDFDYAGYLSRYGIHAVMYRPKVNQIPSPDKERVRERWTQKAYGFLLKIKHSFESQMNRTFSTEPSSSFMAGLLLGSRKGIPDELSEAFRITGLTHIIAISGYNITLIASILLSLFKPFGKKLSLFLAASGIIVFTLFVGASAAVVRACIMGLISLFALHQEQKTQITITLLLTAVIMVGWNPKILFHDVGFQLSFLATMGLIYVAPLIEPFFRWIPERWALRESILLTISAQIMALPIILLNFQALSVVSPLSNLLIAGPILPLAMLFGFFAVMMSYLSLSMAKLIAFPASLLLKYVANITFLTAQIPYANIDITWFSSPLLVGYFMGLSILLISKWKHLHQINDRIKTVQVRFHEHIHYNTRLHFSFPQ